MYLAYRIVCIYHIRRCLQFVHLQFNTVSLVTNAGKL